MNNKLEHIGEDIKNGCFAVYEIIGTEYIIEYVLTAMMSIRVTLRKSGSMWLNYNWCAGPNMDCADYLRDVICEIVLKDDVDLYPLCSDIKPFYNDIKFSDEINKIIEITKDVLQHRKEVMQNL